MMGDAELITKAEAKLNTHEAVCAERYQQISERLEKGDKRMSKMEYWIYAVFAAVLLGPGAAAEFFKKLIGM